MYWDYLIAQLKQELPSHKWNLKIGYKPNIQQKKLAVYMKEGASSIDFRDV